MTEELIEEKSIEDGVSDKTSKSNNDFRNTFALRKKMKRMVEIQKPGFNTSHSNVTKETMLYVNPFSKRLYKRT